MDIVELYNSLKELPYEDYCVLKNKISEFHNNGIDSNKIYKLIKQYCSVKSFCDIKTINNADYIDFIKILKIATFLKSKFDNETLQSIMQNTLIYRDNDVCIFRPTTFEESKIIGEPICCFAYNQNGWDEHYIGNEESIYYVYDVMRCDTSDDFVAITVRPNGRALVLDKDHNWWTKEKSLKFIHGLGDGASLITTKDGKTIKNESKFYKINKNIKNRIVLRESELHKLIKDSVNMVLNFLKSLIK